MHRNAPTAARNTVSFAHHLASSEAFKPLFSEGMMLVEEAAAYLDGPGRQESRFLPRYDALAYASESMRLDYPPDADGLLAASSACGQ